MTAAAWAPDRPFAVRNPTHIAGRDRAELRHRPLVGEGIGTMVCKKTRGSSRLEREDRSHDGRRVLKRLLQEAQRVQGVRAELDGERSDHIEQLIENLEEHIGAIGRGEASPEPDRFRYWLDSVCSLPAGSPDRWRQASRRALAPIRPLASTKRPCTATGSKQEPKKIPGKVA